MVNPSCCSWLRSRFRRERGPSVVVATTVAAVVVVVGAMMEEPPPLLDPARESCTWLTEPAPPNVKTSVALAGPLPKSVSRNSKNDQ